MKSHSDNGCQASTNPVSSLPSLTPRQDGGPAGDPSDTADDAKRKRAARIFWVMTLGGLSGPAAEQLISEIARIERGKTYGEI